MTDCEEPFHHAAKQQGHIARGFNPGTKRVFYETQFNSKPLYF